MGKNFKEVKNGNGTQLNISDETYISVGKNGTDIMIGHNGTCIAFDDIEQMLAAFDLKKASYYQGNPNEYKGYSLRESGDVKYLFKARPYDEAEYYTAQSQDKINWRIIRGGKKLMEKTCDFHTIVDIVDSLNSSIKPRMCHN